MPFTDHHDIVETFPSNRPNYPLGIRVLPRRARRNHDFPDAQRLGLTPKSFSIDLVSVSDQILRSLLQAARLEQLPRRPFRGRVLGDIEMHQPAPAVAQHHKHEEHSKGRRGYREEVQGDQILGVILQKRAPRLRRWPSMPEDVLRNRRLRDRQAQLQQLAVDPGCAPERIGAAHPPNQITELRTDHRPTPSASTLPCPIPSEAPTCHRTTVSGRTTCKDLRQFFQSLDSTTQKIRSEALSCGHGWRTFQTASCCRSARFSSANSRCVRIAERSVPTRIPSHLTITGQ